MKDIKKIEKNLSPSTRELIEISREMLQVARKMREQAPKPAKETPYEEVIKSNRYISKYDIVS